MHAYLADFISPTRTRDNVHGYQVSTLQGFRIGKTHLGRAIVRGC
jgi:hypothetical protein